MGKFTKPEWKKDFDKELEEVQKKLDSIKKTHEMMQKIQNLEDKKQITTGMKPTSHNYEMM